MAVFLRIMWLNFVALISYTIFGGNDLSYQNLSASLNFWNCRPTIAIPVSPRILPGITFSAWIPTYESTSLTLLYTDFIWAFLDA